MKAFGWEQYLHNAHYKCVRIFTNNVIAAGIYRYRDNNIVLYAANLNNMVDGKLYNKYNFKTLKEAKEYCDKMLEDSGIETINDSYRVLL